MKNHAKLFHKQKITKSYFSVFFFACLALQFFNHVNNFYTDNKTVLIIFELISDKRIQHL